MVTAFPRTNVGSALLGLVQVRLLGVGSELLLGFIAEIFASSEYCVSQGF